MPMKRSGRSVDAASRVIEIDDVLVPTMVSGFSAGQSAVKILRLVSSCSVAASMTRSQSPRSSSVLAGRDALDRSLAFLVADALLADLTRQIAVDGGERRGDAVGRDVVEQDVIAGQRADMGDAVAHLAGADDPDLAE